MLLNEESLFALSCVSHPICFACNIDFASWLDLHFLATKSLLYYVAVMEGLVGGGISIQYHRTFRNKPMDTDQQVQC